jgi:uncharacterized protein (DUF2384 family)
MGSNQKRNAGKVSADVPKNGLSKPYRKRLKNGSSIASSRPGSHKKAASPRLISPESVAAHALATFGSPEKAQHWMHRANPLFHGKTPAQIIDFDPVGVEAELVRIDHGVYV